MRVRVIDARPDSALLKNSDDAMPSVASADDVEPATQPADLPPVAVERPPESPRARVLDTTKRSDRRARRDQRAQVMATRDAELADMSTTGAPRASRNSSVPETLVTDAPAAPRLPAVQSPPPVPALPPAPDYLSAAGLDPGPRPLDDIEPEYPAEGKLREGTVVLRLLIGATGHVDNVAVVRAYPEGVFDQSAITAFADARFSPGMAAGLPTKSQITIEVHFAPFNRGAKISGRSY